jgi:hypothetical protein
LGDFDRTLAKSIERDPPSNEVADTLKDGMGMDAELTDR